MDKPNLIPWPPIILVATIAISIALHYYLPLGWPPAPFSDLITGLGIFLIAAVIAIYGLTFRLFKVHDTTVHPNKAATKLITGGPFAVTRNPIYLANVLLIFALGLLIGTPWLLIAAPLNGFITQKLAIEREEKHLSSKFGKAWRDYAKRVRRWI